MPDKPSLLLRAKAKVRALLPEHWRGQPGDRLRSTIDSLSEYNKKNVRIAERLEEAPDMAWNALKAKGSEALVNAADAENKRITTELARRTLTDKARQESATADRLEAEARMATVKELDARLDFVEKLRKLKVSPVWDSVGKVTFVRVPPNYDWDELTSKVLGAPEPPSQYEQIRGDLKVTLEDATPEGFGGLEEIELDPADAEASVIVPESIESAEEFGSPPNAARAGIKITEGEWVGSHVDAIIDHVRDEAGNFHVERRSPKERDKE